MKHLKTMATVASWTQLVRNYNKQLGHRVTYMMMIAAEIRTISTISLISLWHDIAKATGYLLCMKDAAGLLYNACSKQRIQ